MQRRPNSTITNETIGTIDWAAAERQACLRSISTSCHQCEPFLAPGMAEHAAWMTDVSAMDQRSVKAHLAGRGDCRVLWWRINHALHRFLRPQASLEQVMYAFHQRHHFLTLAILAIARDHHAVYPAI